MDFSKIEVDNELGSFIREVKRFYTAHVTNIVLENERRDGGGFDESLHLALGKRGWLFPDWPPDQGGAGLSPLERRILEFEAVQAQAPFAVQATTVMVANAIRQHATPELARDLLMDAARGRVRFCLGYTEPDGGSDIAAARTRATRDGGDWIISGSKVFTTGAQHCQYVFLLTRTDPTAPKHRGLTMFLVPLDTPGIEIQPIHTIGGERSNVVYYGDVRVSDRYRLGAVNEGWTVLSGPLYAEHGVGDHGHWNEIAGQGTMYLDAQQRCLEATIRWAKSGNFSGDRRPVDDPLVHHRIGEAALELEAGRNTPAEMGRVKASDSIIRIASDLLDLVGPAGLLPHSTDGCLEDGIFDHTHRYAQGTGIYGGTVEIFRMIIAQRILGLPRLRPKEWKA